MVFADLIRSGDVAFFMDDIVIAADNIESHLEILKKVLALMVENNLELRIDKCNFLQREVEYLGYRVSSKGISPNISGVEAVNSFPIPRNARDI